MAARATRRPHARRVRPKPVKTKMRGGGGGNKGGGGICGSIVLAPASLIFVGLPLIVALAVGR